MRTVYIVTVADLVSSLYSDSVWGLWAGWLCCATVQICSVKGQNGPLPSMLEIFGPETLFV